MARKPMVTRTVNYTNCKILVIELKEGNEGDSKPYLMDYKLLRKRENSHKLLLELKKIFSTEYPTIIPLKIISINYESVLKGMTEEEFVSVARTLSHY